MAVCNLQAGIKKTQQKKINFSPKTATLLARQE